MGFQRYVIRCVGRRRGRSKGDTLWWNKGVKEAVSRKKEAHKAMCQNSTAENKRSHKSMKNKANSKSNEREGGRGAY